MLLFKPVTYPDRGGARRLLKEINFIFIAIIQQFTSQKASICLVLVINWFFSWEWSYCSIFYDKTLQCEGKYDKFILKFIYLSFHLPENYRKCPWSSLFLRSAPLPHENSGSNTASSLQYLMCPPIGTGWKVQYFVSVSSNMASWRIYLDQT